jgi:hypothetical protein
MRESPQSGLRSNLKIDNPHPLPDCGSTPGTFGFTITGIRTGTTSSHHDRILAKTSRR